MPTATRTKKVYSDPSFPVSAVSLLTPVSLTPVSDPSFAPSTAPRTSLGATGNPPFVRNFLQKNPKFRVRVPIYSKLPIAYVAGCRARGDQGTHLARRRIRGGICLLSLCARLTLAEHEPALAHLQGNVARLDEPTDVATAQLAVDSLIDPYYLHRRGDVLGMFIPATAPLALCLGFLCARPTPRYASSRLSFGE